LRKLMRDVVFMAKKAKKKSCKHSEVFANEKGPNGDVATENLEGGAVEKTIALDELGDDFVGLAAERLVARKDGNGEGAGTKDGEGVCEDGGVILCVEVCFKRHKAETGLWCDMDGGIGTREMGVHAVSTGGEKVFLNERSRKDGGDTSVESDLMGVRFRLVVGLEEGRHRTGIEIAHHDLHRLFTRGEGVCTGNVNVPMIAGKGTEDVGRSVGEELVERVDLRLKAAVRMVLTIGPAIVFAREDDAIELEFEDLGVFKQLWETLEKTRRSARLDHKLRRIDKETRL